MQVYEKIRQMRLFKGWSQEDIAAQLEMSVNGYAKIERGETDVQVSRLEQIAQIFDMDLMNFLGFGEKNYFYLEGDNNNNHNSHNAQHAQIVILSHEAAAFELEKCRLMLEHKNNELASREREIAHLEELIALLKSGRIE